MLASKHRRGLGVAVFRRMRTPMGTDTRIRDRDLQRAARARQKARSGLSYHQARDDVLEIREIADENEWSYDEAEKWYDDPGNQPICDVCGLLARYACPECSGCMCETRCTGWRHAQWRADLDLDEDDYDVCFDCGGRRDNSGYGCDCDDY